MQPRSEKFFTLISKAGPNVAESAAMLMKFVAALGGARQTHARHRVRWRRHHLKEAAQLQRATPR
jgi:hypothetical protein